MLRRFSGASRSIPTRRNDVMMKKIIKAFLCAAAALMLAASLVSCGTKPADKRVVMTVGGEKVLYDEFRYDTDPTYNYNNVEIAEKSFYKPFCKMMNELIANNKNVLYFLEESPNRVKAIIKSIALNPKIKAEFVREFSPCRSVADVLIPKAEINIASIIFVFP